MVRGGLWLRVPDACWCWLTQVSQSGAAEERVGVCAAAAECRLASVWRDAEMQYDWLVFCRVLRAWSMTTRCVEEASRFVWTCAGWSCSDPAELSTRVFSIDVWGRLRKHALATEKWQHSREEVPFQALINVQFLPEGISLAVCLCDRVILRMMEGEPFMAQSQ